RLSEVVRTVKSGEHVLVTDRGTVVAEMVPPGRSSADPTIPSGLARLAERGVARVGAHNDPSLYRDLPRLRKRPRMTTRLVADDRHARLNAVATRWALLGLDDEIMERARRPFPAEPIRTLDAIHFASALIGRKAIPELAMLSVDTRIRRAATRLGFPVVPSDT